jgi:hypothetical protein
MKEMDAISQDWTQLFSTDARTVSHIHLIKPTKMQNGRNEYRTGRSVILSL